jgi:lysophospholipase L1-like esterase
MLLQSSTFVFLRTTSLFTLLLISSFFYAQTTILENKLNKLTTIGCLYKNENIAIIGNGYSYRNRATLNQETVLEEINLTFDVTPFPDVHGNCFFAIGKQARTAGTMVEFLIASTESSIRIAKLNNTHSTFVKQYTLPFQLNYGQTYSIRIGKNIRTLEIEISSNSNYYFNDSLKFPNTNYGCMWGTPFLACQNGKIITTAFTISTSVDARPTLAAWGDSFIEGNSLTDETKRYISIVKDSLLPNQTAIMGRGGESSGTLISRFNQEAYWFKNSKFALLAIGVNDINFSTWKTNILRWIDTLRNHNIIPILTTLTPRADRVNFINAANYWIRNTYQGAYIDLTKAVSINDRYWISGMALLDSIHPSEAGHLAMFQKIKIEAPYLFNQTNIYSIDYINEQTNEPIPNNINYSFNATFDTSFFGNQTIIPLQPAKIIYFKDSLASSLQNSITQILAVPKRPTMPKSITIFNIPSLYDWEFNPDYLEITNYEFSLDSGLSWLPCIQKPIINDRLGSIYCRIKASETNFKSDTQFLYNTYTEYENNFEKPNDVTIYPNPLIDVLNIMCSNNQYNATILSIDGKQVYSTNLSIGLNTIDISFLKSGIYLLILKNQFTQASYKMVKQF